MTLSRRRLNELYKTVEAAGLRMMDVTLEPQSYSGEERGLPYTYDSYIITHAPSGSRLTLDDLSQRPEDLRPRAGAAGSLIYRVIALVPDSERVRWRSERADWADAREDVADWARTVRQVSDTPDLWDELVWAREYIKLVGAQYENAPFTSSEQELISVRLRQIAESLAEQGQLTDAQLGKVAERLNVVSEAGRRLGRKDWLMLFYGGIFSLIISGVIPQDIGQHIVVALIQDIVHMFQVTHSVGAIEGH